jgi:hypothetical protein
MSLFLCLTHDIIYRKENKKKQKEYRSEVGRSQLVSAEKSTVHRLSEQTVRGLTWVLWCKVVYNVKCVMSRV